MNPNCACPQCVPSRRNPVASVLRLVLLYVVLVCGAGTLINTGQPVAVEVGQLVRTVTFVDPVIGWSRQHGLSRVAAALTVISDGLPVGSRS